MNILKKCVFNNKHEIRIIWNITLALVLFFVLFSICNKLNNSKIYIKDNRSDLLIPLVNRIISKVLRLISVLVPSLIIIRFIEKRPVKLLGLNFNKPFLKEHLIGVLIGFCLLMIGASIYSFANLGEFSLNKSVNHQIPFYLLCILGAIVSASYEEILFRGYIFQKIIEGTNYWIAQLIVAIIFGLSHLDTEGFTIGSVINAILAGFLLGHLYFKTRSLWMPIGLHWSWNFFMGPIFGLSTKPFLMHTMMTYEKNSFDSLFPNIIENNLFIFLLIAIIIIFHYAKLIKPIDNSINPWNQYPSVLDRLYSKKIILKLH